MDRRVLFGESRATSTAERCKTGDEIFRLFARWYKVGIRRSCVTTKYVSAGTGPPDFRWRPKSSSRTSAASDSGTRAFLASPAAPWVPIAASSPPRRGRTSPPPSRPWPRERARVRIPPVPRVTRRRPPPRPRANSRPRAQPLVLLFLPRSGADVVSSPCPIAAPLSAGEHRALRSSIPTTAQSMEFGQLVRKKSLVRPTWARRIGSNRPRSPTRSFPARFSSLPGRRADPSRPRALSRISPHRVLPPTGTLFSKATSPPPTSR